MRQLYDLIKAYLRRDSGVSAIEFSFIAPVLFMFTLGILEVCLLFIHNTLLVHSIQEVSEQIRIGETQCYSPTQFREAICSHHLFATTDTCNKMDIRQLTEASFGKKGTGGTVIESVAAGQPALFQVDYVYDWYIPYLGKLFGQEEGKDFVITQSTLFRTEFYESDSSCS